jgi:hypothetical protein
MTQHVFYSIDNTPQPRYNASSSFGTCPDSVGIERRLARLLPAVECLHSGLGRHDAFPALTHVRSLTIDPTLH